jgi:hypothetical protein
MDTWIYFALLGSHVAVAWMFYQKGMSDAVEQISFQQEQLQHQKLWQQMTQQFEGDDDEEE